MVPEAMAPLLETARLRMLPHQPEDWPLLHRLAADPEVMRYITGGVPFQPERTRAFVDRQVIHFAEHGFCRWKLLLRETGEYVGFCGAEYKLLDGERAPEIGWWLAKEHWGKGLATEAAACSLAHVWDVIRLPRVTSCAFPENRASIRVMEKIGLSFEKYFNEPSFLTGEIFRLVMYAKNREQGSSSMASSSTA